MWLWHVCKLGHSQFFMEPFKLSFLFFEIVEIRGVPRGIGGERRPRQF